jgi:two-component system response regulator FlrC
MGTLSCELVGSDLNFRKSLDFAKNIAVTKSPVLITGDSGTGKKSLAFFIHQNSARKNAPFYVVDCNQDMSDVEKEILGFRDEETQKFCRGAIENSNGGTVVFANIDALDESFQKKLYKIIQELPDYELDVRLIATTTKNLSKLVAATRFQRSLYSYFSTSQIGLGNLKERSTDVVVLANYLLNSISENKELTFSEDALNKLQTLTFDRNINSLEELIERAIEKAENNVIGAEALSMNERKFDLRGIETDEDGVKLMSLREAEKLLIKKALIYTSENRTQAAKILGVSIRTLRNKINEYRTDGTNYFINLR